MLKLSITLWLRGGEVSLPITNYCIDPGFDLTASGFLSFTADLRLSKYRSFLVYSMAKGGRVVVSWGGGNINAWEGRIEDVSLSAAGVGIMALGNFRALEDIPLTLPLSVSNFKDWRPLNQDDYANASPERFRIENRNFLYIALKKNEQSDNTHQGAIGWRVPDDADDLMNRITFDYELVGPSGYAADCRERNYSWVDVANLWSLTTNGTTRTGSVDVSRPSGASAFAFRLYVTSGSPTTYTGETGDLYLKITNLRVYGNDDLTMTARDVMLKVVNKVSGENEDQLSDETGRLQDPGLDLPDLVYVDTYPIDIVKDLEALGDDQTPPRFWRAAVWEGNVLSFAPVGEYERIYYVNFGDLVVNQSVDNTFTAFYGVYTDDNRRRAVTNVKTDVHAAAALGFTRRRPISVKTNSVTQAQKARDAASEDARFPLPFSAFTAYRLYSEAGSIVPIYMVRPDDRVIIRNWPPTFGEGVNRINSFRVLEVAVDMEGGFVTLTPEDYPRSLDQLIARREAGV